MEIVRMGGYIFMPIAMFYYFGLPAFRKEHVLPKLVSAGGKSAREREREKEERERERCEAHECLKFNQIVIYTTVRTLRCFNL